MRAETGSMDFGSDWSGIFIRGDNCWDLKNLMNKLIEKYGDQMDAYDLERVNAVARLFGESHKRSGEFYEQSMKEYGYCLKKQYEPKSDGSGCYVYPV